MEPGQSLNTGKFSKNENLLKRNNAFKSENADKLDTLQAIKKDNVASFQSMKKLKDDSFFWKIILRMKKLKIFLNHKKI